MPKESKMKGSPLSKTFVIHLLGVGETFWMARGHLRWMGRGRMAGMAGQGRPEISVFDCGWSSSELQPLNNWQLVVTDGKNQESPNHF